MKRAVGSASVDKIVPTTEQHKPALAFDQAPAESSSTFLPSEWRASILPLAVLGGLTLLRLVGLSFSQVDLIYDESQYWAWSRNLVFGYFSKPPLLGWVIAMSNAICGTTEACVRSSSPLFYFGQSFLVYEIARVLYDRRIAFWSACTFILLPAVSFSSRIVSTDVPLLFFWALALLAFVKLLERKSWLWTFLLGAAIGLGLLSKYAMLYFFAGIALSALIDVRAKNLLLNFQLWCAVAISFLVILPNLIWNSDHGFVTFEQTADNIAGGAGFSFSPRTALEFLLTQAGIFGPLVFAAFIGVLATIRSSDIRQSDRLMIAFALPPMATVFLLALLKPVNANWAAATAISLVIVTIAVWLRRQRTWLVFWSLGIGALAQVALLVGDVIPYQLGFAFSGKEVDVYHRTLGWRELGQRSAALAQKFDARTVIGEGRYEMASLIYYMRDSGLPVVSWPGSPIPDHQFDMSDPIGRLVASPALFVSQCKIEGRLLNYFGSVRFMGTIDTPTGPNTGRQYYAFVLDHQTQPIGFLPPCGS